MRPRKKLKQLQREVFKVFKEALRTKDIDTMSDVNSMLINTLGASVVLSCHGDDELIEEAFDIFNGSLQEAIDRYEKQRMKQ